MCTTLFSHVTIAFVHHDLVMRHNPHASCITFLWEKQLTLPSIKINFFCNPFLCSILVVLPKIFNQIFDTTCCVNVSFNPTLPNVFYSSSHFYLLHIFFINLFLSRNIFFIMTYAIYRDLFNSSPISIRNPIIMTWA